MTGKQLVVRYSASVFDIAIVDIVMEYGSGGSIRSLLDRFQRLDEKVSAIYIKQVLDALIICHDAGILHRDIKGSNILIDSTGKVKISDFGCCKQITVPL